MQNVTHAPEAVAGPGGRRTQMTIRAALLSVVSERRRSWVRRAGGQRLAVPPEAAADTAGERPYERMIAALKAGGDVEVGLVLAREALQRARRPMPIVGSIFVLTGDDRLEAIRF